MVPLEQFKRRVDAMIREIRRAPKAKGSARIYLPGEMEWQRRREALAGGIPLPEDVLMSLRGLAQDLGIKAGWLPD
jgi:ureidoglycolate dehydrogenase (NAD+)